MPTAFLSYASSDQAVASALAERIRARGIDLWVDKWDLQPGKPIRQQLESGIEAAQFFFVLLSPRSLKSPWVEAEIDAGLLQAFAKRCLFVPLVLELKDAEVPLFLRSRRFIRLGDIAAAVDQIVDVCLGIAPDERATAGRVDHATHSRRSRLGATDLDATAASVFSCITDNNRLRLPGSVKRVVTWLAELEECIATPLPEPLKGIRLVTPDEAQEILRSLTGEGLPPGARERTRALFCRVVILPRKTMRSANGAIALGFPQDPLTHWAFPEPRSKTAVFVGRDRLEIWRPDDWVEWARRTWATKTP